MTKVVTALYDNYSQGSAAVNALMSAGVPQSEISIVANNAENWHREPQNSAGEDAAGGAEAGVIVGGIGGLLTGLGLMAIPGVGPVVAMGWLVSTLAGAATGAAIGGATGGIIGSMTTAGVPEDDANLYAEGVRRGGTLVTAKVDDVQETEARAILLRTGAVDLNSRGRIYRETGWSSFDAAAPAYTAEEIEAERTRYR
jgi:hypothetical protein